MSEITCEHHLLEDKNQTVRVYKRRWIILIIFVLYSAISALQWIEYAIINNIVTKYYNVSAATVDWTSIIYMACYAPLVLPAAYVVERKGVRTAALVGGLGTAIGTIIKVFSAKPDMFWLVLVGQFFLAISQTVILSLPPRLAAVWFGADEISTACALGVFGTQLGTGIGFILPSLIVKNHENLEDIGKDLYILCWILAGFMIPVAIVTVLYFPKQPPSPPNHAQLIERTREGTFQNSEFKNSLKELISNSGYLLHTVSYGINIAAFSCIGTLLNQYILEYFPNREQDAGYMGLLLIICGMTGTVIFGVILDKTHKFKECCVGIYAMCVVGVVMFMFALHFKSMGFSYFSCTVLGGFTSAYWSVGFEMATELTFPVSEMTSSGLIISMSQVLGVLFTVLGGVLINKYGSLWSLASQGCLLFVGTITTIMMPNELRRQKALRSATETKTHNKGFESVPETEKPENGT